MRGSDDKSRDVCFKRRSKDVLSLSVCLKRRLLKKRNPMANKSEHRLINVSAQDSISGIENMKKDYVNSDEEDFCEGNGDPVCGENYVIDRILARKTIDNHDFFYIKWLGWSYSRCTWEPKENIICGGQAMIDFVEKEKSLLILGASQRLNDDQLFQLRNLDRWERKLNTICSSLGKKIFVLNSVDDVCGPPHFKYINQCVFEGQIPRSEVSVLKQCCCPLKYFCDGTPVFVSGTNGYKFAIARTRNCGWGLFALENISKGKFVFEFVGEILSVKDANRRSDYNYQFDLNCSAGTEYVIDAKYMGNESAFVNHSCTANLRAVILYDENAAPAFHRIALFSKTNIKKGEELTLDYYPQFPKNRCLVNIHKMKREELKCRCESPLCIWYFPEQRYLVEID